MENTEKTYGEMTEEEFDLEIKEQEEFANGRACEVSKYDLEEIKSIKRDLIRNEQIIAEHKEKYLESIKSSEQRVVQLKERLYEKNKSIIELKEFKESMIKRVQNLKDIKKWVMERRANAVKEISDSPQTATFDQGLESSESKFESDFEEVSK